MSDYKKLADYPNTPFDIKTIEELSGYTVRDIVACYQDYERAMAENEALLKICKKLDIELDLSVRSYCVLKRAGFDTVEDVKRLSADEIKSISHMRRDGFEEITDKLSKICTTNADHIRSMSDEELAEFVDCRSSSDIVCPVDEIGDCFTCTAVTDWLKQPYEEGNDDR